MRQQESERASVLGCNRGIAADIVPTYHGRIQMASAIARLLPVNRTGIATKKLGFRDPAKWVTGASVLVASSR